MNKCDPFYCEGLTRGHIFWCRTFGVVGQGGWGSQYGHTISGTLFCAK